MNILKRQHVSALFLSLILVVVGVLLIFSYQYAKVLLTYVLGGGITVISLFKLGGFILSKATYRKNDDLIEGIFLLLMGTIFVVRSNDIYLYYNVFLGIFFVVKSSFLLSEAIDLTKLRKKNWWADTIFLSYTFFYSVILIFYIKNMSTYLTINIIAFGLISDGLCTAILSFLTYNRTELSKTKEVLENLAIYSSLDNNRNSI